MKTSVQCPTVKELEKYTVESLIQMAVVAELAIAKPYFLDRLKVAINLKGGI